MQGGAGRITAGLGSRWLSKSQEPNMWRESRRRDDLRYMYSSSLCILVESYGCFEPRLESVAGARS
jgi:hypothetical protein